MPTYLLSQHVTNPSTRVTGTGFLGVAKRKPLPVPMGTRPCNPHGFTNPSYSLGVTCHRLSVFLLLSHSKLVKVRIVKYKRKEKKLTFIRGSTRLEPLCRILLVIVMYKWWFSRCCHVYSL
jgi:hypothetical protein